MAEDQSSPERFPATIPDSVVTTLHHVYELEDLVSEADVNDLLHQMFDHPERVYELYLPKDAAYNRVLRRVTESGWLLVENCEFFFYRLPEGNKNFARIRQGDVTNERARRIVDGPMYKKLTLALSRKAERGIEEALARQRSELANPIEFKPGLWGLRVDAVKLLKRCLRWLQGQRRDASNRT